MILGILYSWCPRPSFGFHNTSVYGLLLYTITLLNQCRLHSLLQKDRIRVTRHTRLIYTHNGSVLLPF